MLSMYALSVHLTDVFGSLYVDYVRMFVSLPRTNRRDPLNLTCFYSGMFVRNEREVDN